MAQIRATQKTLQRLNASLTRVLGKTQQSLSRAIAQTIPDTVVRVVEQQLNEEQVMEQIIYRRFTEQREAGFGGRKRWRPLTKNTIADRMRNGFPGARPILVRTGALMGAAISGVQGTFRFRKSISFNVNKVTAEVPYAGYHETGTRTMPRRSFYMPPTSREMLPIARRARALMRAEIKRRLRA